jgi:hypothetical protein
MRAKQENPVFRYVAKASVQASARLWPASGAPPRQDIRLSMEQAADVLTVARPTATEPADAPAETWLSWWA